MHTLRVQVLDPSSRGPEIVGLMSVRSEQSGRDDDADLGHVTRTPYVAILTLTTLALAASYIAWSGTSVAELLTAGWGWDILGGLAAAAVIVPLVRGLPSRLRPEGSQLAARFLWEGVVYGTAEAICSRPCLSSRSGRLPMRSAGLLTRAPRRWTSPLGQGLCAGEGAGRIDPRVGEDPRNRLHRSVLLRRDETVERLG